MDLSQGIEFEAEHPTKSPADVEICKEQFDDIINKPHCLP
jgi:hypothetical protein